MPQERLFTSFHDSFTLNLPAISVILRLSRVRDGRITYSIIRGETSLGTRYVKAMPHYAQGCGLMGIGSYSLTPLGQAVARRDPGLSHPATLWAMHYHLSAPQGPGPAFWSHLVANCLPFHEELSKPDIKSELARFLEAAQAGKTSPEKTVQNARTAFVGTYTKSDGLGRLGLLEKLPRGSGVRVSGPQSAPLGVLVYALADYWSAHYGGQATVSLSELARDHGFARLMWTDVQGLEGGLEALRRAGLLDLYRTAPYQVVKLWPGRNELLDQLYDLGAA